MAERQHEVDEDDINDVNDVNEINDVNNSLEELKGQYETVVASLTACIKGLKSLKSLKSQEKESPIRIRKGGIVKSLKRVLDKAEQDAIAAGTSYGTAVLEALEGAESVDTE